MIVICLIPCFPDYSLFLVCFTENMNPAQELLAKTLAARARRAITDAQAGVEPTPASGSGGSSSAQPTAAMSPISVSSKAKRLGADGSVDLTDETGKGNYDLPPCWL